MDTDCLYSVIANTNWPYKISYFDNYNSGYTLTQIWNKLINESKSEYICLLNNDAFPTMGWLEKLMTSLLYRDSQGFIGPSTNQCHSIQKSIYTEELAAQYKNKVKEINEHLSGFCVLFPRVIWSKLKGFDEKYTLYGQESDFMQRAKDIGYHCWWRKDVFVNHIGEATVKRYCKNSYIERKKAKDLYHGKKR